QHTRVAGLDSALDGQPSVLELALGSRRQILVRLHGVVLPGLDRPHRSDFDERVRRDPDRGRRQYDEPRALWPRQVLHPAQHCLRVRRVIDSENHLHGGYLLQAADAWLVSTGIGAVTGSTYTWIGIPRRTLSATVQ